MENVGWIKLHRKMLDWQWYNDTNVKVVFLHLLIICCYAPAGAYGFKLQAGQVITTTKKLSAALNLSAQQVRLALNKLQKTNDINVKTTNKFTLITVVNYNVYQSFADDNNKQTTIKQQTDNKQVAIKQQTDNKQTTSLKEKDNNINNNNNVKNDDDINIRFNVVRPSGKNSFLNCTQKIYNSDDLLLAVARKNQARKDKLDKIKELKELKEL